MTSDGVLAPAHDAAHVKWGGRWRMPTLQELIDLGNKCDWTPTTQNGVKGLTVRGRGDYAAKSIFLPCAGNGWVTSLLGARGSEGKYWSSCFSLNNSAYGYGCTFFSSSNNHYKLSGPRCSGYPVRPVQSVAD